ncbi:hypothetical protein HYS49_01445 [Candidatus Woesearchaeota archaeon]|nr:hypothetical protein [Candidatus Woesearchaeota archaeon]
MQVIERKIQEIGQTLLVSLPKPWADGLKLKKGAKLKLVVSEQGHLLITPEFVHPAEKKEAVIIFDTSVKRRFFREYFRGNEKITIKGTIPAGERKDVHEFLSHFMDVQVIEDTKDRIVMKCFRINELTVDECLNRMFYLSLNLIEEGYSQEIAITAKKFYYLLVMQIRRFLTEGKFTKENEMPLIRALDYRMVAEKVDRIIRLTEQGKIPQEVAGYYQKAFQYFVNNDFEKALLLWDEEHKLQKKFGKKSLVMQVLGYAREISMLVR